jgi:YHS domain-containing protein
MKLLILFALAIAQHSHHDAVNSRGDHVMGFSHEKTTHHFKLYKDGGAIQVTVKDGSDGDQLKAVRAHLKVVADDFAKGNLSMPMLIHNTNIPGLQTMKRLHGKISYSYADIANGGSVKITSANPEAIKAVHSFLDLQIKDHQTGDPGSMPPGFIACAVMGGKVNVAEATKNHMYADYGGNRYFFCCGGCPDAFKTDPKKFASAPHIKAPK